MGIKADLHNHVIIGFQSIWRNMQGYSGTNLAETLFDCALKNDTGIVAITSEDFSISPGGPSDRFSQIRDETKTLCAEKNEFTYEEIGRNLIKLAKNIEGVVKPIYFANGQTVIVEENGQRYDHLVVGSNQVPNKKSFNDTINYCADNGLLNFLEHPALETHFGAGVSRSRDLVEKHGKNITGIEGHNAHMIWPAGFSQVPLIGPFNRGVNGKAIAFAKEVRMPYIGTSDAHSPEQTGIGNVEFLGHSVLDRNEEQFFSWMKNNILAGNYVVNEGYVDVFSWLRNATTFAFGKKFIN